MDKPANERYSRHLMLNEIGPNGQKKLLLAKVLVVGAGGLGSPVLQYLAAAGVGNIGIVDADVVSISNLQRQVIYTESQLGTSKVEKAKEFIVGLNSECSVQLYPVYLNHINAEEIIKDYDIVIGATDNFESRKCINLITKKLGIPFVHGSIGEFEGQVTVFNYQNGPSYSDLFPDIQDTAHFPQGVLGVLPGVIGSLMATEALKIILDIGQVLSGKFLIYNALDAGFLTIDIES